MNTDSKKSHNTTEIQYAFRLPIFPVIYSVDTDIRSASSPTEFQRQAQNLEVPEETDIEVIDAAGEGWIFHCDLGIVSPLTLRKQWRKIEIIRLFNESDTARRAGFVYPEANIPRRSLVRIIADIATLVRDAQRVVEAKPPD